MWYFHPPSFFEVHVRIKDLPISDNLRDLRQTHLNAIVRVQGVVTRRSAVIMLFASLYYYVVVYHHVEDMESVPVLVFMEDAFIAVYGPHFKLCK
jgi:DNA replicative helicase MCM subunit Mcm2 (Cdc46/Mcm family)